MTIIQRIDKNRNPYKNTLYSEVSKGSGFSLFPKPSKAYVYKGGFIDLGSIINAGKSVANFIQDNKDLIQTGVSTVGKVVDLGKTISDINKTTKEIEKIKELRAKKKPRKEYEFSPEMQEKLKNLGKTGEGFVSFKK